MANIEDTITVKWREWYSDEVVKQLSEMGTLLEYETEVPWYTIKGGIYAAQAIAELTTREDNDRFLQGEKIVILSPKEVSGIYEIFVDYDPNFSALKVG